MVRRGRAAERERLEMERDEGVKWQSAHLVSSIMQWAFKRQFVAYWALLTEIKPDTLDAVRGEWKGDSGRRRMRRRGGGGGQGEITFQWLHWTSATKYHQVQPHECMRSSISEVELYSNIRPNWYVKRTFRDGRQRIKSPFCVRTNPLLIIQGQNSETKFFFFFGETLCHCKFYGYSSLSHHHFNYC